MRSLLLLTLLLPLQSAAIKTATSPAVCSRNYVVGTNLQVVAKNQPYIADISSSLLAEIKRQLPCNYQEKALSFTKAAEELKARRLDLYAFAFVTDDWKAFTDHDVLYSVQRLLLIKKKFYKPKTEASDYLLNPKISFGVISGGTFFTTSPEIRFLEQTKRSVFAPYPDDLLRKVELGEVDAAFTSATYFAGYKNKANLLTQVQVIPDNKQRLNLALFYAKDRLNKFERQMFKEAVEKMRKEGRIREILKKHIPEQDLERYYSF